jgi:uncharacterized membrane protein
VTSRADRRKRELALRKEKTDKMIRYSILGIVFIAIVAIALFGFKGGGNTPGPEPSEALTLNDNGELELAETTVTSAAKFYTYNIGGTDVRFFALRGKDGDVRVAFDACDVCYDRKRGYRQTGDSMTCNNCGNVYSSAGIGTKNLQGGCWPSYLKRNVEDGKVLIREDDLKGKKYMFD